MSLSKDRVQLRKLAADKNIPFAAQKKSQSATRLADSIDIGILKRKTILESKRVTNFSELTGPAINLTSPVVNSTGPVSHLTGLVIELTGPVIDFTSLGNGVAPLAMRI
jgi:hypothetical protein